jgi:anaerobic ribonucleoside-triphosphate reductase activating protein
MLKQKWKSFNSIRLAGVVRESIVDGPGLRFTVFCQGCPHECNGCHNEETHKFDGGYDCDISKILEAIDANPLLDGVTFSGGEPFCQPEAFCNLAIELKERNLNLMAYSGYTYEELVNMKNPAVDDLLDMLDILVDGRYLEEERDLTLLFRGSKNQRVLDMPATRKLGKAVLSEKFQ